MFRSDKNFRSIGHSAKDQRPFASCSASVWSVAISSGFCVNIHRCERGDGTRLHACACVRTQSTRLCTHAACMHASKAFQATHLCVNVFPNVEQHAAIQLVTLPVVQWKQFEHGECGDGLVRPKWQHRLQVMSVNESVECRIDASCHTCISSWSVACDRCERHSRAAVQPCSRAYRRQCDRTGVQGKVRAFTV